MRPEVERRYRVINGLIAWCNFLKIFSWVLGIVPFVFGLITSQILGVLVGLLSAISLIVALHLLAAAFHWGAEMLISLSRIEDRMLTGDTSNHFGQKV